MNIPRKNHLLYFIELISIWRGGGGSVYLREEQIPSKLLPCINWLTQIENSLKISIGISLKYSNRFVPSFSFINSQIPINQRNLSKSILGPPPEWIHWKKFLAGRVKILLGKSIHWWFLPLYHKVFLHIFDSLIPSYDLRNSISIPLYILAVQFSL